MVKRFILLSLIFMLMQSEVFAANVGGVEKKYLAKPSKKALELGAGPALENPYPHLLIRIQYPSSVTPAGLDALAANMRLSQKYANEVAPDELRARVVDGVNKSAYFALRLYRMLEASESFPADSIALEPITIEAPAKAGQLPDSIYAHDGVPAVLTIRFTVERNVVLDGTRDNGPSYTFAMRNTFADWVTPRFAIATEAMAWPGSSGLIATVGLLSAPAFSCPADTCLAPVPEVGEFLAGPPNYVVRKIKPLNMSNVAGKLPYPDEVADQYGVFTCPDAPDSVGPSCAHEQLVLAYARQALRQVDPYLATRFQWKRFIARYDPELAVRWPGGAYGEDARKRLALIKKMMVAERAFITALSKASAQAGLDGAVGKVLRNQRQAEREYYAAMHKTSSSFSLASLLSMATTISRFGQAYAAKDAMGQLVAVQAERDRSQRDQAVGLDASAQIATLFKGGVLQALTEAPQQVVLGKAVSVKTLPSLQIRLQDIYKSQQRPPLSKVAECNRFDRSGVLEVAYGTCRVVKLSHGDDIMGYGYVKVSGSSELTMELYGNLFATNGNWGTIAGEVVKLNLYEAGMRNVQYKDFVGHFSTCYTVWDDTAPPDRLYINRCLNKSDTWSDGNVTYKPANKEASARLDTLIVTWRESGNALIRSEDAL